MPSDHRDSAAASTSHNTRSAGKRSAFDVLSARPPKLPKPSKSGRASTGRSPGTFSKRASAIVRASSQMLDKTVRSEAMKGQNGIGLCCRAFWVRAAADRTAAANLGVWGTCLHGGEGEAVRGHGAQPWGGEWAHAAAWMIWASKAACSSWNHMYTGRTCEVSTRIHTTVQSYKRAGSNIYSVRASLINQTRARQACTRRMHYAHA
jgi:hypothetical protein